MPVTLNDMKNICWTTVTGSNKKQCLLIKTIYAVVRMNSLVSMTIKPHKTVQ